MSNNYASKKFIAILMTPTVVTINEKTSPSCTGCLGEGNAQFHGKETFSAVMHISELTSTCILVMSHYLRRF